MNNNFGESLQKRLRQVQLRWNRTEDRMHTIRCSVMRQEQRRSLDERVEVVDRVWNQVMRAQ